MIIGGHIYIHELRTLTILHEIEERNGLLRLRMWGYLCNKLRNDLKKKLLRVSRPLNGERIVFSTNGVGTTG